MSLQLTISSPTSANNTRTMVWSQRPSSWQYQKKESVFRSPHKSRNTTSLRVHQKTTKGVLEPRFQQYLIWGEFVEPLKISRAQCLEPNELRISALFYFYLTLNHIDCEIVFLSLGTFLLFCIIWEHFSLGY